MFFGVKGHGEALMRTCLARHVMYEFTAEGRAAGTGRLTLQQAVDKSLDMMADKVDGYGGVIAVAPGGEVGVGFTTPMMSWAYIDSADTSPTVHYGIERGQHLTEKF
jgi:isoaspartyl peptidase/L-asparaginase-like protein (Ntn-hydrolase superfamily)